MTNLIKFPTFESTGLVVHGFSIRQAGNLALHVGDNPKTVLRNRAAFFAASGIDAEKIVCAQQVHDKQVQVITSEFVGRGALDYETALPATDGMITDVPGIALVTFYADCVPLFFLDPVKKVIGLSHAGWKGTVLGIGPETVRRMEAEYGSRPQDLLVGIGPSIGACCYEVDERVVEQVKLVTDHVEKVLTPAREGHWFLDLWQLNAYLLKAAGVKDNNVSVANLCTACHVEQMFSYRKEQGQAGRMAAYLMLTEI